MSFILPCWDVEAGDRLIAMMRAAGFCLVNCASHTHHVVEGGYRYGTKYSFERA